VKKWYLFLLIPIAIFILIIFVLGHADYSLLISNTNTGNSHYIKDTYYSFNPNTIVSSEEPNQFIEIEEPDDENQTAATLTKVDWSQEQFYEVARKMLAVQFVDASQLEIEQMGFELNYGDYELGPQSADFRFTQSEYYEMQYGLASYITREWHVWIEPSRGYGHVSYSEYYPIRRIGATIDLSEVKVSAEQAIKIAGEIEGYANNGYGETPNIFASLKPGAFNGWHISFNGSNFQAYIDPVTGKILKVINP
jgi:hypothetical protein